MIQQDYSVTITSGITTSTGNNLGPVNIHRFGGAVYAKLVAAKEENPLTQSTTAFQVALDGSDLFATSQTITAGANTFETFTPDQNRHASGANVDLTADIVVAGASTYVLGVLLESAVDED